LRVRPYRADTITQRHVAHRHEVLDVLTDHPPVLLTIPRQTERLGFRLHVEDVGPSEWVLTIWK